MSKNSCQVKATTSKSRFQLVRGEENTHRLIKSDGRLEGHWADLWQGYTHTQVLPTTSSQEYIRQIETQIQSQHFCSFIISSITLQPLSSKHFNQNVRVLLKRPSVITLNIVWFIMLHYFTVVNISFHLFPWIKFTLPMDWQSFMLKSPS